MGQITTTNPATDETITKYDVMDKETAFAKVDAAHTAFLDWKTKTHKERAVYLRDIAAALRENADAFAKLMTNEMGKLLRDGQTEIELCAQIFEYTADHGPDQLADEDRTHSGGEKDGIVAYCPIGVMLQHPALELSRLPTCPRSCCQPDGGQCCNPETRRNLYRQRPDVARYL